MVQRVHPRRYIRSPVWGTPVPLIGAFTSRAACGSTAARKDVWSWGGVGHFEPVKHLEVIVEMISLAFFFSSTRTLGRLRPPSAVRGPAMSSGARVPALGDSKTRTRRSRPARQGLAASGPRTTRGRKGPIVESAPIAQPLDAFHLRMADHEGGVARTGEARSSVVPRRDPDQGGTSLATAYRREEGWPDSLLRMEPATSGHV